jgi:hypothetical protein
MDVFGRAINKIKKIVKNSFNQLTEFVGKMILMKLVFANLNNHSSPPPQNGWTASKIGYMRLCMI